VVVMVVMHGRARRMKAPSTVAAAVPPRKRSHLAKSRRAS
jgi:hypothetical protein